MSTEAAADPSVGGSVISLPKGGGAVAGLGEKFAPDLFTGTGNVSVPIALPAGRLGRQPQFALAYSTGTGNGPFGLGWQGSLPGIARKTSHGIPRYVDDPDTERPDVFVLSGAEDLVPVGGSHPSRVRYRPRTEGLFARIEHVRDGTGDYWEVRSRDGLLTRYGTPRPESAPDGWRDPAAIADPANPGHVFGWRITETRDPLDNLVRYGYVRDRGEVGGRHWDQPLLARISYVDYGDAADPAFLVQVEFEYEPRPDPFSEYRAGFEIRTTLRCRTIRVATHTDDGVVHPSREYRLSYQQSEFNGASLLARVEVVGIDDSGGASNPATEHLPPLTFGYSGFELTGRRFRPVTGVALSADALTDPTVALVDLRGAGLPDLVQFGAVSRFWRNAGSGRFEAPRPLTEAPPVTLGQRDVRLLDADGDGRPDLVTLAATGSGSAGYFPMTFATGWSRRSFQPYAQAPAVDLNDTSVKLVDLDGDGLTDILQSGTRLRSFFNDRDPRRAWQRIALANGGAPDVDLADPRVRVADMTGDGLSDIVLLHSGSVTYWPNLGHGRWGAPVAMAHPPRLPDGYDPRRVLLGDVDGDGAADLFYIDRDRVLVWGNRLGEAWTEQPLTVTGTPGAVSTDAVQLADLTGTGMAGVLYQRTADGNGRPQLWFLDLTGGVKPHLLTSTDNHLGALTRVHYRSSTEDFLRDQATAATRWRTTLPFPVQVVASVEVVDAISGGRLFTGYRYRHGYWDGLEREFRGFALVEQTDSEVFEPATAIAEEHFSPPMLTRNWFHPGPVAAVEVGDWTELDLRPEYWPGDPSILSRPAEVTAGLAALPRLARRSALRAMRGRLLRTELYALDGTERADRPYAVTETLTGVRVEAPGVYFPFELAGRATRLERGDDPMTRFTFVDGYDGYGMPARQLAVAVPRGRDPLTDEAASDSPYLSTLTSTEYARRDDANHYLIDRVARTTTVEVVNDGRPSVPRLRDAAFGNTTVDGVSTRVIGHSRTYFDGEAFTGLPLGVLGVHGLPVRTESLTFTDDFLDTLYRPDDPLAVGPRPVYLDPRGLVIWTGEYPEEFRELTAALAGYWHYGADEVPGSPGGFYTITARHRYDVQSTDLPPGRAPRGLTMASLDPRGAEGRMEYDRYDLLPVRAVDPVGLATAAEPDYRILQPRSVTDANGNGNVVDYSAAGLVTARYTRGKDGEGDRSNPGTRLVYDLLAFAERGQPASVRTIRRVHHDADTDVPTDQRDEVIVSVEYSDGFGRAIQSRAQNDDVLYGDPVSGGGVLPPDQSAPPGEATAHNRAPSTLDNVVVSGWQIYDNKGRVVRKYEPFFAIGFDYGQPGEAQLGQPITMFRDPRGQVVRTVNPDGSEQRVVLGVPVDLADPDSFTPTAWETYTYDANDNAGRTHPEPAQEYRSHWNTPSSMEVDALGRTVTTVARNSVDPQAPDGGWFTTKAAFDIQGNPVSVTDALGRQAAFRFLFDLAQRRWRMDSIDAGRRDTVHDALGNVIESRDSKGSLVLTAVDPLHRTSRVWAQDDRDGPLTLRQRIDHGDGGRPDQNPAERAAARAANLLGRPVRQYDEAGLVTTELVDFKGNVLRATRRVIADAPVLATYDEGRRGGWKVPLFTVDWQPAPDQSREQREAQLLEPAGYPTTSSYDGLNRLVRHILPADVEGRRRVVETAYGRSGGLAQLSLDGTVHVQRIAYDARGKRSLIAYGNGIMTRYAYDPWTFRLIRLRTEQYSLTDEGTYHPKGTVLQDCGYDYDLIGNVLAARERAPGSGVPNNPTALTTADPRLRALLSSGDALDRRFGYDPVYRLRSATGREASARPSGDPWLDSLRGTDSTLTQPYEQRYRYDAMGSMLQLAHAASGGFTRDFTVAPTDNRLRRTTIGKTPYDYLYDANGNLVGETASRHFGWNHADRLATFATQTAGVEPSVHAHYLYNAAGVRVKKLVRRQGGAVEVTHYLGGIFEHHRWSGPKAGANNHVHVLDDHRRVALVRLGPAHPDDRGPAVAFHLADHLGSSTAVVDEFGALTNREEYTPYGETSFGSFSRKRYRFAGQERDEESGVAAHGARYYAPWLARWTSVDPAGPTGGVNLYLYCADAPLNLVDRNGHDFTVVYDTEHNTMTLGMVILVRTAEQLRQVETAARTFNTTAAFTDTGTAAVTDTGMQVRFDVRAAMEPGPGKALAPAPGTETYLVNRYRTGGNFSKVVGLDRYDAQREADIYIGGITLSLPNGGLVTMNRHRVYGDLGNAPDLVNHEICHLFGLDDEHPGEDTGRFYVPGGIMDPAHLSSEHNHRDPTGQQIMKIRPAESSMIMKFVHQYQPEWRDPRSPFHVDTTPRVAFVFDRSPNATRYDTYGDVVSASLSHSIEELDRAVRELEQAQDEWINRKQPAPTP